MSSETSDADLQLPRPFAPGEWEAIVAAAVANVAALEAAHTQNDPAEAAVCDLLDAQPAGTRAALSLPVPAGVCARVPTWHSRRYWLSLCEWIAAHTERGRDALTRHGIAAQTFLRVCASHAQYAESTTGRHISASLTTLADHKDLSIDKLKRGRRVLKTLELGIELARGKKLNAVEREAAARLYTQVHRQSPVRLQIGAASVWALSAPAWAIEAMPAPEKPQKQPRRKPRRRPARSTHQTRGSASHPVSPAPRRSPGSAPQSLCGSLSVGLSVRKDHPARARAGEENSHSTMIRPLTLQRAAAQLVDRIPALRAVVGIDDSGERRGHIGSICDLLVDAGIDTDRWTGLDIARALTHDGSARGWTWPTTEAMTSPLRLVAYRLNQIDWTVASPTETTTRGRKFTDETPAQAAHRLIRSRRRALASTMVTQARPASAEHRRAIRTQFAAFHTARRSVPAGRVVTPVRWSPK